MSHPEPSAPIASVASKPSLSDLAQLVECIERRHVAAAAACRQLSAPLELNHLHVLVADAEQRLVELTKTQHQLDGLLLEQEQQLVSFSK